MTGSRTGSGQAIRRENGALDLADQTGAALASLLNEFSRAGTDWFWETDARHRLTWVSDNPLLTQLGKASVLGRRRDQLPGVEADDPGWLRHLADLEAGLPFRGFRYRILPEGGKVWHVEVSGRPRFGSTGRFLGYRGVGLDVTRYVDAQIKAEHGHHRLIEAIDQMANTVVLTDPDDRLVIANRAWLELNPTVAKDTLAGRKFEDVLRQLAVAGDIPNAQGRVDDWLADRLERRRHPQGPFELRRQDDRWLLTYDEILRDGSTITIGTDITVLKRTEAALRDSETRAARAHTRLVDALESITEGFALYDADDRLILRNTNALRIFGQDADLIRVGTRFEDIIRNRVARGHVPEAIGREQAWIEKRIKEHREPGPPVDQVQTDGRWVRMVKRKVSSGGIVTILTDITEQKETERGLRESHARLQAIVDANPIPTVITRADDGRILFANRHFAETAGWDPDSVIGRDIREHYAYPEERETLVKTLLEQGRVDGLEVATRRADGEVYWVEISAQPLVLDGETAFFGAFRDITERKRSEERVRQAQKMEAIGQLAGGVAHDFNNILQIIGGFTQLALNDAEDGETIRGYLDTVLRNVGRAREIVAKILTFSRQQASSKTALHLEDTVREAVAMLRATLPTSIDLDLALARSDNRILADETQIQQVVVNLCTNAARALGGEAGRIRISVDPVTLKAPIRAVDGDLSPGRYMRLGVADDGVGIEPAIQGRIFEPFFTTRAVGEGTGLGLAVVHGIVLDHDGGILLRSTTGKGTEVEIYFPLADDTGQVQTESISPESTDAESGKPEPAPVAERRRVLFVDDEPDLVFLGRTILQRHGYAVETAMSGLAAFEIWQRDPDRFDLVITDQTMPGMTGATLARRIHDRAPELPVVLCTGYSTAVDTEHPEALGVTACILKPLTSTVLISAVERALTSVARPGTQEQGRCDG